jgi:hypothetical protein
MKERYIEVNDNEKRKIEDDCANAPISTNHKLAERGKTLEDLWMLEHESELMEAARARRELSACSNDCDDCDKCGKCGDCIECDDCGECDGCGKCDDCDECDDCGECKRKCCS